MRAEGRGCGLHFLQMEAERKAGSQCLSSETQPGACTHCGP